MNDLKSEEKLNDRFRSRFLKDCEVTQKILDNLLKRQIYIAHIEGSSEFITSDNPGFTIADDLLLNMGGFDKSYQFGFPLSSKQFLIIDSHYLDKKNLNRKVIHPIKFSQSHIDELNGYTFRIATTKIFASSKEVLYALNKNS